MRLRSIDSNRSARPAVIPMMAIFLPRSILLWRESVARESAFQRAVPHGNLAGITSLEVRPGATKTLPRWKRAPLDQGQLLSALHRLPHPHVGLSGSLAHFLPPVDRRRVAVLLLGMTGLSASLVASRRRAPGPPRVDPPRRR